MLTALKGARFKEEQRKEWERRVTETFDAQRELIFVMLHGLYCDPSSGEEARLNALSICETFCDDFSPRTCSALVDRHQDYKAKGDEIRHKASLQLFERIGQLSLLSESELHSIFTSASRKLLEVHNGWDNFYNEPPFAERLADLSRENRVPKTAQPIFVEAVVTAAAGNPYGVSRAAEIHYKEMIKSFSPKEIRIMLTLPTDSAQLSGRIKSNSNCKYRYQELVTLLDEKSVPTSYKRAYQKWLPSLKKLNHK